MKCENEKCGTIGVVKPDIVFFGEQMPAEFQNFRTDFAECDCLIVMGTSLKVYPFSSLVNFVRPECPRLLINRDLVGDWATYESAEDDQHHHEDNYRDVAFLGDCDDGCDRLAELLGMKDELQKLYTQSPL